MDGLEERKTGTGSDGLVRGESTGVRRTRPTERAKEKGKGETENMIAKEGEKGTEEKDPRRR